MSVYQPYFLAGTSVSPPLLQLCGDDGVVACVPVPYDLAISIANAIEVSDAKAERVPLELHALVAKEIRSRSRLVGSPAAHRLTAALAVLESA